MNRLWLLIFILLPPLVFYAGCGSGSTPTNPNNPNPPAATNTFTLTPTLPGTPSSSPTDSPTSTPTNSCTSTATFTPTSTPTLSSTNTILNTATNSPTHSPTDTATKTPTTTPTLTPTVTPTVGCQGAYHLGYDVVGYRGDVYSTGYVHSAATTLTQPATITSLSIYLGSAFGSIRVGVYDDAGNRPGTLKCESSSLSAVQLTWNNIDVPDTYLPAGVYWLSFQIQSGTSVYHEDSGGTRYFFPQAFGPFPATAVNAGAPFNFEQFSFYANYCQGNGTYTPQPTPTFTSTSTFTFTPTPTFTFTPEPVLCGSPYHLGYDVVGYRGDVYSTGYVHSAATTLTQPATVTSLAIYLSSASGLIRGAIYDDAGNRPGALKCESGSPAAVQLSWNTLDVPDTYLPAGVYWLSFQIQTGTSVYHEAGGGSRYFFPQAFGPFPVTNVYTGAPFNPEQFSFYANYCVGPGTPTPLPTATFTYTPTFTSTPTFTYTYTPEPVLCGSPYHLGYDVVGYRGDVYSTGYVHSAATTLTQPATVTSLAIYLSSAFGLIRGAIYDDAGNRPGALKCESGSPAAVQLSWNTLDVPDTYLPAGVYWLSFQIQTGTSVYHEAGGGTRYYFSQAFGPFPATAVNAGAPFNFEQFSFYANYCVGPGTPTPLPTATFTITPTPTP